MQLLAKGLTDVGRKRSHNEDTLLCREDLGLFLVADGMGGHAGGEIASAMAAETVAAFLDSRMSVFQRLQREPDNEEACDDAERVVFDAIHEASRKVFARAQSENGKAGMGTTLTLVVLHGNKGVMGHVGDSRLYLERRGELHQLSEDHSYVNELIRRGLLAKEEAEASPYANVITRAVGIQADVQADTLVFDVLPGDTFLLCSDGLSRYVTDDAELQTMLKGERLDEIPTRLVAVANDRGGKDNITAICVRSVDENNLHCTRTQEVLLRVDTLQDIKLFQQLTLRELMTVMESLGAETRQAGSVVVREGDPGVRLYVVLSGHLQVSRQGRPVADLRRGTHFGEMALLNQRPRSASVRAVETSRLLYMTREAFQELVRKHPELGVKLLWSFGQELSLRLDEATLASEPGR